MHHKMVDGYLYRYYTFGERLPDQYQIGNDRKGWTTVTNHPLTCEYVPFLAWGNEYRELRELKATLATYLRETDAKNAAEVAPVKKPKKTPRLGSVCINSFGRVGVLTSVDDDTCYGFGLDGKGIWQSRNPKVLSKSLERYRRRVLAAGGTGGFMYAYPVSND